MKKLTVTTKRQATLPVEVCEEMGIRPGDKIALERRTVAGETVWILRAAGRDWSWFGGARRWAKGRSHRWEAIEESIGQALAGSRARP